MGRGKTIAVQVILVAAIFVISILASCRPEQAPLDRNRAPDTHLTCAPTETTATDYRVHLYWYGTDNDGTVERYIWYISDTLLTLDPAKNPDAELRDWNPASRIADYLKGRFTSRTDTVIIFKGFDDKKLSTINRQSFHIAAIDDGGKIDPTPARIQFYAKTRGLPSLKFWVNFKDPVPTDEIKEPSQNGNDIPFNPLSLDTISMFAPFTIKFKATTPNNVITGYRWSYESKTYPDFNNDGTPEWLIPSEDPKKVVAVKLSNMGAERLRSGVFNFKGIARDEAGAISKSDLVTGEGYCRIVINHDPDTEILYADCFYTPRSSGVQESIKVYFNDAIPDTLPYNSRLRFRYRGWDDKRDSLEFVPPLPIRFQFQYSRWALEGGLRVAEKNSPWYPLREPEDTNPKADIEDGNRNVDSTTMRVGTFNYRFSVRSFDEQNRPDGTPAEVFFVGNFPPIIDSVQVGYFDNSSVFRKISGDTLYVEWLTRPLTYRGDTISAYSVTVSPDRTRLTKTFRFNFAAWGQDDHRDPPNSGIKSWMYTLTNPVQDLAYYKEGEWQAATQINYLNQDLFFSITVPLKTTQPEIIAQADSIVANPPLFLGFNTYEIFAKDLSVTDSFDEGIRGITPQFDENGNVLPGNNWLTTQTYPSNYARLTKRSGAFYIKLLKGRI